jgi:hypothetical protein
MNDFLHEQIAHVLRLRVLQEIKLLTNQIIRNPTPYTTPLIRKLRRSEWKDLQETGIISDEDALAVIVVPPLNRNPISKKRPEPIMSASPPPQNEEGDGEVTTSFKRPPKPISELAFVVSKTFEETLAGVTPHPPHQIPIYHGPPLFPSRSQRASLGSLLSRLVLTEVSARHRSGVQGLSPAAQSGGADSKASHAFLIRANSDIAQRADVAPLAIALWRLRMYEGQGWEDNPGWIKRLKHRSMPDSWE